MENRFVTWCLAVVVTAGFPSWAAADPAAVLLTVTGNIQPAKTAAGKKVTFNFKELSALGTISSALDQVNFERAKMGAVISRLQFAGDNLFNVSTKATESRSRIEDTDYSMATTDLARRNIIQQAAQAMLAQANQAPQLVLQLLK